MGALRAIAVAIALVAAHPAAAQASAAWRTYVAEAAARFAIPEEWIERVMAIESGGRTLIDGRPIRSSKGAIGLMQLMPRTWRAMRDAYGLGADPDDPHDNILAGAAYLRLMYARFGYPGLFGAYNAGPGRYAAALSGAAPLPQETRDYLDRATGIGVPRPSSLRAPPLPSLFAIVPVAVNGSPSSASLAAPTADALIVIRHR